ncbi:MAG: universal stress protein [Bacteroidetes bacterium]|nr:universal stress protein [Bacteroidota bacterium]
MKYVNNALVAMDTSDADHTVLNYLHYFSRLLPIHGAHFVHVVHHLEFYKSFFVRDEEALKGEWVVNEEILKKMQADVANLFGRKALDYFQYQVLDGNPLEELLKIAETIKPDLVVLGKKKGRDAHGILAKNFIRKVDSAALIIPENAENNLNSILVPIDFSENAERALETAINMANHMDTPTELICIHVFTMPDLHSFRLSRTEEQFDKIVRANIKEGFEKFIDKFSAKSKYPIKTVLEEKDMPGIARHIMDYTEEKPVDIIIIGAKGHSKVERLLMGSVTERLINTCDQIPVLVVQ